MRVIFAASFLIFMLMSSVSAMDQAAAEKMLTERINEWLLTPTVIDAVKAQNAVTRSYDQARVDAHDKAWKIDDVTLLGKVMESKLSEYLKEVVKKSDGLYTEIIIMDAKGLNVGLSNKTSDFWQGDEDKFTKTFLVGLGAVHLGEVEMDESSHVYALQLSVTLGDKGIPIGAATIGLNADRVPE
jgi:hypothetical protein